MDVPRRRQNHSCDPCRKGKRACDADLPDQLLDPFENSIYIPDLNREISSSLGPCSNCKKWKRDCTFRWLSSIHSKPKEHRSKRSRVDEPGQNPTISTGNPQMQSLPTNLSPHLSTSSSDTTFLPHNFDFSHLLCEDDDWPSSSLTNETADILDTGKEDSQEASGLRYTSLSTYTDRSTVSKAIDQDQTHNNVSFHDPSCDPFNRHILGYDLDSNNFHRTSMNQNSPGNVKEFLDNGSSFLLPAHSNAHRRRRRGSRYKARTSLLSPSHNLSDHFARSTMSQNLIRIYHDSMENALTCWLTERTCPYSSLAGKDRATSTSLLNSIEHEWGPNWTNRICLRVCQLDRAFAGIRGRDLTSTEDKVASKTLHTTIMAFATQWAPDSTRREELRRLKSPIDDSCSSTDICSSSDEINNSPISPSASQSAFNDPKASFREGLWSQARQALNDSADIMSFRVIFANILFSLSQRPLNIAEYVKIIDSKTLRSSASVNGLYESLSGDEGSSKSISGATHAPGFMELQEMFDSDPAPKFLDTALRQLFSFRYKFTKLRQRTETLQSSGNSSTLKHRHTTSPSSTTQPVRKAMGSGEAPNDVLRPEDKETFNLLFWLGVMFDTLTAAMHQRPLIVSDQDSEVSCAAPSSPPLSRNDIMDLDGFDIRPTPELQKDADLWGNHFLMKRHTRHPDDLDHWPYSFEEAAEILSDAAPVKVLLFRRVTSLQTLVYRGAGPDSIEKAIKETLRVYHHWNRTYSRFMTQCMHHHDTLPPRIQSWYVILMAHWHLAGMLFADTLEDIDKARDGHDIQRQSRHSTDLVSTLRMDNAVAVSDLAQCSLREQGVSFTHTREFHDIVNEGALLTEPWTAVLVRSLTRAGYILLGTLEISDQALHISHKFASGDIKQRCRFCIDALWCLGKKSDMSLLAARALSNNLEEKVCQVSQSNHSINSDYLERDAILAIPDGYNLDVPILLEQPFTG